MRVRYLGSDNASPDAMLRIKSVVTSLLPLFPQWILELDVTVQPLCDNDATIESDTMYCSARLRMDPRCLALPYDDLELVVIHEIMHTHLAKLMSAAQQARKYPGDDDLFDSVLTEKHESSTQELAHMILRLWHEKKCQQAGTKEVLHDLVLR